MDIQQFAENHSLKVTRDSCGAFIVQEDSRNADGHLCTQVAYRNTSSSDTLAFIDAIT